jgi:hypothetical protein
VLVMVCQCTPMTVVVAMAVAAGPRRAMVRATSRSIRLCSAADGMRLLHL